MTGVEAQGGLQLRVYDPKPGIFPDRPPRQSRRGPLDIVPGAAHSPMGFAPGGQIDQKVVEDPHGLDTWDPDRVATLIVHVLNSAQYHAVTGGPAPPSPVSAATYTEHGFPWFKLYEEDPYVPAADPFAGLTTIADIPGSGADRDAGSLDIPPSQVIGLKRRGARRRRRGAS
jgi:hypothetical protein